MNDHVSGEDLAAYVDGLLAADKKNKIENHFSCCPACLDELAEIVAIMGNREKVLAGGQGKVLAEGQGKIPAQFLLRALGGNDKAAKPVLHLRLVFEVAAALVVVVFIGYLSLSGNRFWQTPGQPKPPVVSDKNVSHAEPAAFHYDRADARRSKSVRVEGAAAPGSADLAAPEKRNNAPAQKSPPAAIGKPLRASAPENKLQEIAEEKPQPTTERENLQKNELAPVATAAQDIGAVQMDSAAKDQTATRVMEKKATAAEQNLERQKGSGAGASRPIAVQAKTEKLQDEESLLKRSVTAAATAGAAQQAYAGEKHNAALDSKTIAAKKTVFPVHVEGDVAWTDLRNPELLSAWTWWQNGLILELQIDGAGTVTAAVALGKIEPLSARQAENEARKLLFSVSEKKSRRARLSAEGSN